MGPSRKSRAQKKSRSQAEHCISGRSEATDHTEKAEEEGSGVPGDSTSLSECEDSSSTPTQVVFHLQVNKRYLNAINYIFLKGSV